MKPIRRILVFLLTLVLLAPALSLALPAPAQAAEDYRAWEQADSRWGGIRLGSSSETVAESGCLVTSITKLAIQSGLKSQASFRVDTLVNWLNANGGFVGDGLLCWNKPAACIEGFTDEGELLRNYNGMYASSWNEDLLDFIRAGYHLLVCVNWGGHWVAVDEARSLAAGRIYIMDSRRGQTNADITLEDAYGVFVRVHAFSGEGEAAPVITSQPEDKTVTVGTRSSFCVAAGGQSGLSYQWQYSDDDGETWKDATSTGCRTATVKPSGAQAGWNGRQYRCLVTGAGGTTVSGTATLSVKPKITTQPASQTAAVGSTIRLSVTAVGKGPISYQWQYKDPGRSWTNSASAGARTATLRPSAVKSSWNGRQYRCLVTGAGGTTVSVTAVLTLSR